MEAEVILEPLDSAVKTCWYNGGPLRWDDLEICRRMTSKSE